MKVLKSEEQILDVLVNDYFIVVDQLSSEAFIYKCISELHSNIEQVELEYPMFELLDNLPGEGVITCKRFISKETSMAVSFQKWLVTEDGIQGEHSRKIAFEKGLLSRQEH